MPNVRTMRKLGPMPVDPRADAVMVPMRDGVRLATDVYLPPSPGKIPTVLLRLPYDKCGEYSFVPKIAERFNAEGYAFVAQDVRGKFRSEGSFRALIHEVQDGYDTIDWIVSRSFSNGVVDMSGESYYGFTQWAAAVSRHPALRAISPRMCQLMGSYFGEVFELRGLVELAIFAWLDENVYVDYAIDYDTRPLLNLIPDATGGRHSPSFDMLRALGVAGRSVAVYGHRVPYNAVRIPVLHTTGWWDSYNYHQIGDYLSMAGRARDQFLLAQSTDHCDFPLHDDDTTVPDYWSDPDVLDDFIAGPYLSPTIEFYERFLKGRELDLPPVRWHLANADWRSATSWPPEGVRSLRLFLGGPMSRGAAGGSLSEDPRGSEERASWVHDPTDMVPTDRDGDDTAQLLTGLPDERRVEDRDDVLTFTSDPLGAPLDLAGLIRLSGSVGSSHTSMQLVLKLIDVLPSGRARAIAERAVHVDGVHPERHVDIDIGFAGYRVGEGHSVRLEVASSAFPKYIWHPGTDEDPWTAVAGKPNEQFIRVGGHASFVEVDVLPPG